MTFVKYSIQVLLGALFYFIEYLAPILFENFKNSHPVWHLEVDDQFNISFQFKEIYFGIFYFKIIVIKILAMVGFNVRKGKKNIITNPISLRTAIETGKETHISTKIT
ncbi:hypothetical protein BpHYR1_050109 [Brachionus plicatilis]|uniref:Uncharacterized protein n=1 Tax=Brachionus plicatilis TaxID=10195 RepID=A0A3M7RBH2_BRAPC|nr:hypothetical protein BpHYR1_050109 [Brachionus plicatilis]